jgi:NADH-quinone oxidoreductase subunit L
VAEEISLMLITIGIAATGILVAYHFYIRRTELPGLVAQRFSFLHRLLRGKFFIDELYDAVLIHPIRRFSTSVLWRGIDVSVVDGAVNGTARVVKGWSGIIRLLQSGFVRSYAAWILVGSVLVVVYCLFAII